MIEKQCVIVQKSFKKAKLPTKRKHTIHFTLTGIVLHIDFNINSLNPRVYVIPARVYFIRF